MDTSDEIALEDHPYFLARLDHLEIQNPTALLHHLEMGTLTDHLREVTVRALQAKASLIINHEVAEDQANEMVMNQLVADPQEQSHMEDPESGMKLQTFLARYKAALPTLPRTYQSESETTE